MLILLTCFSALLTPAMLQRTPLVQGQAADGLEGQQILDSAELHSLLQALLMMTTAVR